MKTIFTLSVLFLAVAMVPTSSAFTTKGVGEGAVDADAIQDLCVKVRPFTYRVGPVEVSNDQTYGVCVITGDIDLAQGSDSAAAVQDICARLNEFEYTVLFLTVSSSAAYGVCIITGDIDLAQSTDSAALRAICVTLHEFSYRYGPIEVSNDQAITNCVL